MKILLDTNIFIPLEPTSYDDIEYSTDQVMELQRIANDDNHEIFLHPASLDDIKRDKNSKRMQLRVLEFSKYSKLETSEPPNHFLKSIKAENKSPNDQVDNALLYSTYNNAVHLFVTEDRGIHSKAKSLGIEERVYLVSDALLLLKSLKTKELLPPPAVEKVKCYNVDVKDEIFDSLRKDYGGFNKWFEDKCQKAHRDCFIIKGNQNINGICVFKDENNLHKMHGKILKLCTFKIATHAKGFKYGELLLRAVFNLAYSKNYDWIYVTAFPKNLRIKLFLENFGFRVIGCSENSKELIIGKRLKPKEIDFNLSPLDFHILAGPKYIHKDSTSYIIPIQPKYASILFPELEQQGCFFEGCHSFGNSILKAYLSHSKINTIYPGNTIYFYRSKDIKAIQAIGVVEKTFRSIDPDEIYSFVGKRTVYTRQTIERMCNKEVYAILFRQANSFEMPITVKLLKDNNVFIRPPQSIMSIKPEGAKWLARQKRM